MSTTSHSYALRGTLWIIDHFDRPCEEQIVVTIDDEDHCRYLVIKDDHPWVTMRLHSQSTPLEKFGVDVTVFDHPDHGQTLRIQQTRESVATYRDGKPRRWQGSPLFHWLFNAQNPKHRRLDHEALDHYLARITQATR